MASSSNDTYAGALEVLIKQLAVMSMLPDANLPFVTSLLEQVRNEARSPEMAMQKAGVIPTEAQNPQGIGALGLPGGGPIPAPGPAIGGPVPGVMAGAPPVPPEALAAIMSGQG